MKLGLLVCDHVLEPLQDIAGDYPEMFARWLPADWRIYEIRSGEHPADPGECDAYVGTGSKASVYDDEPWIHGYASLVRRLHDSGKPFLGVCFGHQMLGHALGGRVARSERGWGVGVHTFEVYSTEGWMKPETAEFSLLMSCQDQVQELPPGAVVLAGNDHCPVGMFRVDNMVGVQGHPEFVPAYSAAVLDIREERIGRERTAAARASLHLPLDGNLLRQWAKEFFGR